MAVRIAIDESGRSGAGAVDGTTVAMAATR